MADNILTEYYCTECNSRSPRAATPNYCPDCGTKDPWDERPAFRFEEDDLPIVFSHEIYDDHSALWRSFAGEYFGDQELTGQQIADLPADFPALKYCVFDVWFKITQEYEVKGPFLSEEGARGS